MCPFSSVLVYTRLLSLFHNLIVCLLWLLLHTICVVSVLRCVLLFVCLIVRFCSWLLFVVWCLSLHGLLFAFDVDWLCLRVVVVGFARA